MRRVIVVRPLAAGLTGRRIALPSQTGHRSETVSAEERDEEDDPVPHESHCAPVDADRQPPDSMADANSCGSSVARIAAAADATSYSTRLNAADGAPLKSSTT